ncbi:MAG: phosphotransferase [bacterium]
MIFSKRDLAPLAAKLAGWIAPRLGDVAEVTVEGLRVPSAGLSNETVLFDLGYVRAGTRVVEPLVLRAQPTEHLVFPDYDLSVQRRVLEALAGSPVHVPEVRWSSEDVALLGTPFYVMRRVAGVVPSDVPPYHAAGLLREASPERRAAMWWAGIDELAAIHRLDPDALGLGFLEKRERAGDPLERELGYWSRYLDWAAEDRASHTTTRAALAWLHERRPAMVRRRLCWGDARLPNLIFDGDRVVAVLDWEMAFLGEPTADLAWWLFLDWHHSEGYGIPRLAGLPSREETLARWERGVGLAVSDLGYWEVFAAMRFAVIMVRVASIMRAVGTPLPTPDFETNNAPTQRLAALLGLEPPGGALARGTTEITSAVVRVQFDLSGPNGYRWYLVADRGTGTRVDGVVADPDITVRCDADDWHALQRGELDRAQTFLSGKLAIEGDISTMMQLEEIISALVFAGPGATYTAREAAEAADRAITVADDRRHEPGPESLPLWNESLWFPMYDAERDVAVVFRAGVQPNLGLANLYLGITRGGELVHHVMIESLPPAPFESDRLTLAAGVTIEWREPLRSFALRYAGERHGFDLLWEGIAPPYKYAPPPGTSVDQVPRHIEHSGRATGTVTIDGEPMAFAGWAHRDHSFGGERDWDKFWRWTYLSGRVGERVDESLWFNAVEIRFGAEFPPIHIGCVAEGGAAAEALARVEVELPGDDATAPPRGATLRIVSASGRAYVLEADEVRGVVPARFRDTVLHDGIVRYRSGDRSGWGILETGGVLG